VLPAWATIGRWSTERTKRAEACRRRVSLSCWWKGGEGATTRAVLCRRGGRGSRSTRRAGYGYAKTLLSGREWAWGKGGWGRCAFGDSYIAHADDIACYDPTNATPKRSTCPSIRRARVRDTASRQSPVASRRQRAAWEGWQRGERRRQHAATLAVLSARPLMDTCIERTTHVDPCHGLQWPAGAGPGRGCLRAGPGPCSTRPRIQGFM